MKCMNILENFCMHNKLSVHSSKLKVKLLKTHKSLYNNEPLETVESFKYLGFGVSSCGLFWMEVNNMERQDN